MVCALSQYALKLCLLHKPQQHRHPLAPEGNFKEYDADLRRRKGPDADQPHRVTYKKLVRSPLRHLGPQKRTLTGHVLRRCGGDERHRAGVSTMLRYSIGP